MAYRVRVPTDGGLSQIEATADSTASTSASHSAMKALSKPGFGRPNRFAGS